MNSAASSSCCNPSDSPPVGAVRPSGLARVQTVLVNIFDALATWHERALDRRRLAALDERMLHDIGLDAASAAEEAFKPFWRR
jgi:uncharacterized protein YjiS (DUF1127 family)